MPLMVTVFSFSLFSDNLTGAAHVGLVWNSYVPQAGIELMGILLLQPPEAWAMWLAFLGVILSTLRFK